MVHNNILKFYFVTTCFLQLCLDIKCNCDITILERIQGKTTQVKSNLIQRRLGTDCTLICMSNLKIRSKVYLFKFEDESPAEFLASANNSVELKLNSLTLEDTGYYGCITMKDGVFKRHFFFINVLNENFTQTKQQVILQNQHISNITNFLEELNVPDDEYEIESIASPEIRSIVYIHLPIVLFFLILGWITECHRRTQKNKCNNANLGSNTPSSRRLPGHNSGLPQNSVSLNPSAPTGHSLISSENDRPIPSTGSRSDSGTRDLDLPPTYNTTVLNLSETGYGFAASILDNAKDERFSLPPSYSAAVASENAGLRESNPPIYESIS